MNDKKTTAVTIKEATVDAVAKRIRVLENSGELHFPPDYSPQNALKSAWLILQDTLNKDKKPVLEVCTRESIMNSLLDMVITGLNPEKAQGYFIAYGRKLAFQRSYFGSMALAKRVDPNIAEIVAELVYESDKFAYRLNMGKKEITCHEQTIEAVNSKKVKAAYCVVIGQDGEVIKTDIMTFDEIKVAWKMSKMNPITDKGEVKNGSTHEKFIADMCRKTVINHCCKPIINSSDDKYLKLAASRSEVIRAEDEAEEDIEEHANQGDVIDIDPEPEEVPPEQEEEDEVVDESPHATGTNGPDF